MKVLVAPDSSMYKTPDNHYWCPTIYDYGFFERYLQVFNEVIVVSRVKKTVYDEVKGFLRCDGPNLSVVDLPDMHGMKDYIKNYYLFSKIAKDSVSTADCAIIRLPSITASMVLFYLKRTKKRYCLEIVADPADAYSYNVMAKLFFSIHLKHNCLKANGVSYVTRDYLEKKYPSYARKHGQNTEHFETYYSTIRIPESYYGKPKRYIDKHKFIIIHTANNMSTNQKGHEVLIRAVKVVVEKGFDVCVRFVGDGSLKHHLKKVSEELLIQDRVEFLGRLSSSVAVREELLKADMLVFPTTAEGLPRTIIEAMAVGLPCISTPVAGIPELLEPDDLIDPVDIKGFAYRMIFFMSNPVIMEEKSKRNIAIAREYSEEVLSIRRNNFYNSLKSLVNGK